MNINYQGWLPDILSVAKMASELIKAYYSDNNYHVKLKLDNSPVTEADTQAHLLIEKGLKAINPSIPILSEEGELVSLKERSKWSRFWLIDPLDGTKEFIHGTDEFTINIALIEQHEPVLGVVVAPILEETYWAVKGSGAYFQRRDEPYHRLHVQQHVRNPLKVVVSRHFHQKDKPAWIHLIERIGKHELVYCGSALKMCLVAKGEVDLYPRLGPTGEWDTAAGQCILEEAGGQLLDLSGKTLQYNTRTSLINPGFYAIGSSQLTYICCG